MRAHIIMTVGAMLTASCSGNPPPEPLPVTPPSPSADSDPCNAAAYGNLIGNNIAAASFPAGLDHRIVGPGTMVTMDHVPKRLNFNVDKDGKVLSITCG